MAITDTYENEPRTYPGQQDAAFDVLLSLSTPAASIHELPELPDRTHGGSHRRPQPPGRIGAVEAVSPKLYAVLVAHLKRLFSFSLIGGFVLLAGIGTQWLTVRTLGANGSYVVQAVFSIELGYVLNRYVTWRDRGRVHGAWLKWNAQRLGMTLPNWLVFALLVHFGVPWLAANLAVTAMFVVINYVLGDAWSFRQRTADGVIATTAPKAAGWMPTVSVVIPCKSNQRTIRATVTSLLGQDYPNLIELVLVGDVGDTTWQGLDGITDPRLIVLEHSVEPQLRDPNVKRHKGLNKAHGEVLALADSDIVMDDGWLTRAVALLGEQGSGMVAGGMRSIHDTFWGRFVDGNLIAAKTPRLRRPYLVTAELFGKRGYKPPISANAVFTRDLYRTTPLDVEWFYGYEDYEWLWRVARDGHNILFSGDLTAAHHHRRSYRKLLQEYARASEGCAEFVKRHPRSPLARKRLTQAVTLPLLAVAAVAAAGIGVAVGYAAPVGGAALLGFLLLAGREVARTRRLEAVIYPVIGLSLAGAFTINLAKHLIVSDTQPPDRVQLWDADQPPEPKRRHLPWSLLVILAVQAAFSLSLVWSNTAFADEADQMIQGNMLWDHYLHGTPLLPQMFHDYGTPQLWPVLGALASDIGGIAGARILAMCFMLAASLLLFQTGRKLFGQDAAIAATAIWAVTDPVLRLTFATWDPLACLLIIAALRLVVQVPVSRRKGETVAAAALVLGLAGMTSFPFAVYGPVVVVVALLVWSEQMGKRLAIWCTAWLGAGAVGVMVGVLTVFHLWKYILDAAATHPSAARGVSQGAAAVIRAAWSWDGLLFALAVAGVAIAFGTDKRRRLIVAALAASALVIPLYQVHLGTAFAMDKQISAGTGLAALAAGYAIARFRPAGWQSRVVYAAAAALMIYPAFTGLWYARSTFHSWPNTTQLMRALAPLANSKQPVLLNDVGEFKALIPEYYLGGGPSHWRDYSSLLLPSVSSSSFAAVVIDLPLSTLQSKQMLVYATSPESQANYGTALNVLGVKPLISVLQHNHNYKLEALIPYKTSDNTNAVGAWAIWVRVGSVP